LTETRIVCTQPQQPRPMSQDRPFEERTEQLIAASRLVLALAGLIAIYFDPEQPSQGPVGYWFVVAYLVFAVPFGLSPMTAGPCPPMRWKSACSVW
jgi:hypothetical protein